MRWRVQDVLFAGGKALRLSLGDAAANTRYFIAADGSKRAYTFGRDRRRDVELATLLDHFTNAGYLGTLPPFDGRSRDPRSEGSRRI